MYNEFPYKTKNSTDRFKNINQNRLLLNNDFINNTKTYIISIPKLSFNLINTSIITYENKKNLIQKYFKENKETYIKTLQNFEKLYQNTNFAQNKIPLNINFEDFDELNNDPNYYFKQQKSNLQNLEILGFTKMDGYSSKYNTQINAQSLSLASNLYAPSILIHEFGHVLDFANLNRNGYILSESNEFKQINDLFISEFKNTYNHIENLEETDDYNYFTDSTEIFARLFATWYDIEIQQYSTKNQMIFNPFTQPRDLPHVYQIGEIVAYNIYEKHTEIEQFFTKHFGEIIPPENAKLYNKTHPNNSISDQSLLNKLNQAIKTVGLDKSKDFTIELEISN